jgi:hypothetical protein
MKRPPNFEVEIRGQIFPIFIDEHFRGFSASFKCPICNRSLQDNEPYPNLEAAKVGIFKKAEAHALAEGNPEELRKMLSHVPGLSIMSLGRGPRTILGWMCGATIALVVITWIYERFSSGAN